MALALIGSTGFVGSNLARSIAFDELYNSKNIGDIDGKSFQTVYCAGARAEKWKANQHPDDDREGIINLLGHLRTIKCERMVLISTVDVYPHPIGVDEETPIDPSQSTAYGAHRYLLEREITRLFPTTIIRLPGLFGAGIKKNVIYDLLHNHMIDRINPHGVFQYYDLSNLAKDTEVVLQAGLPLINFATEPIETKEIAETIFETELPQKPSRPAPRYDFRTVHAGLFQGENGYIYSRQQILDAMKKFVSEFRYNASGV